MKSMIRNSRIFAIGAMIVAVLVVVTSALATQQTDEATHDGTVVSVTGDTLVMASADAKEHSHTLAAGAKLTLDGKVCKTADLKPGAKIRVTTKGTDKSLATRIEALDKNLAFANNRHDGKVISITGDKLVMTGIKAKEERTCTLAADVKVTCDAKVCKSSDLKPGMRIRVTSQSDNPMAAVSVEALDKNLAFASSFHDGKVVSITGNTLVMTDLQGKEEQTCTLTADVKITCDGKVCKAAELKPGMKIRVTSQSDDPHAAIRIEALDKNQAFVSF